MGSGFELSQELISTLCRAHGVEYNTNYVYVIRDVPGGIQMRVSDPQTGEQINSFTTYSEKQLENGFADVEKDILRARKENVYVTQCTRFIYAITFFGMLAAGIMIFGMRYL